MKNVTPCAVWEKKLSITHPEDLSPSERFELAAHIASCEMCAKTRAEYYEMDTLLRNLPTTEPLAGLPPKLLRLWEEEDRQRLASGQQPRTRRQRARKRARFFRLPSLAHNGGLSYAFQRGMAVVTARRGITTAIATGIIVALLLLAFPLIFASPHASLTPTVNATAPSLSNHSSTPEAKVATTTQANATVTATEISYAALVASGRLTLDDPLHNNAQGYRWNTFSGLAGGCVFSGGAYHTLSPPQGLFVPCLAANTNFENFLFQTQLTIVQGDQAGIIFRADARSGAFYAFSISSSGSFTLEKYDHYTPTHVIQSGSSPAIRTGYNQPNAVAVAARGNNLVVFVNTQYVTNVSDSTYHSGQIGVFARSINHLTDVVFSNVKVWLLT